LIKPEGVHLKGSSKVGLNRRDTAAEEKPSDAARQKEGLKGEIKEDEGGWT